MTDKNINTDIQKKILTENTKRLKFISLIILIFSIFFLISDFFFPKIWSIDTLVTYKILDLSLFVISICYILLFYLSKKSNYKSKQFAINFIVFFMLNWAAIITSLDFSSFGISTFLVVMLISVFFIYIKPFFSIIFLIFSFLLFFIIIVYNKDLNQDTFSTFLVILNVTIISIIVSIKNYKNKTNEIKVKLELESKKISLNQRYNSIFDNFPKGAIFLFDKNHKYIYVNGKGLEDVNIKPQDLEGKRFDEVFPESVSRIVGKNQSKIFKNETCYYEIEFMGNIYANWGAPVIDTNGNITEGLIYAIDITELKRNEQKIKQSGERFSALVNHLQTGVFYINTNGEILETNPALLNILGSPSAEATKKINIFNFQPLIDFGYSQKLKQCIETGEIIFGEGEYKSNWDKNIFLNYYFVPIKENNITVGILASIEDITEKKKIEKQLLFHSILLENINDFVTATDLDGNITFVNKKVKDNFIIALKTSKPTHVNSYGENSEEGTTQKEIIDNTLKHEKWQGEVVNYNKNGQKIFLYFRTQLLKDTDGNPYGMIGISTDITLKKRQEKELAIKNIELKAQNDQYEALNEELLQTNQELLKAKDKAEESDKLKSSFLNNISHEFRTPMNGIIGFSDLIINTNAPKIKEKYAKIIKKSCDRLLSIVNDTIAISELQSKAVKTIIKKENFTKIINEIIKDFEPKINEKGIEFQFINNDFNDDFEIYTDKFKLSIAIKHILNNALKFTLRGDIIFTCSFNFNKIEIEINDTGIGIPKEMQKIIFEPYRQVEVGSTRNYGGNGIGLTIAKAYIEMLEGELILKSVPDKGTTVTIYIPNKTKPKVYINPLKIDNENNSLANKKILIVEDENINHEFLINILTIEKSKTFSAYNGKEAIEIFNNYKIDIVLMDIKMPIMDGFETFKILKSINKKIPIIAQTAYTQQKDVELIKSYNFDGYISKPINRKKLIHIIKTNLIND